MTHIGIAKIPDMSSLTVISILSENSAFPELIRKISPV
jgi:hypothetical protein